MTRTIIRSVVVLLTASFLLSSCGARTYTFNGKKSKNCGCPAHRGIIG